METAEILDVTAIEPKYKHPRIFEKFDALDKGEAFIIHNDHDPKPLYYQLLGERGNVFNWEYLENGPEWWKVKIGKHNDEQVDSTIGELVSSDYRKAEVFKKFGLDFCCGGKKTLSKACEEKGLDIVEIEKELKSLESTDTNKSENYTEWELDFLADYILNTHHKYVSKAIPVIFEYTQKVAKVHGNRHPEVIDIADKFLDVAQELNSHMVKEEELLFPYIKEMEKAQKENAKLSIPSFGSIKNPIRMMEFEHENAGGVLEFIKKLANNYTPPDDACTTYRLSYAKLQEFEEDLHKHIHLENNILFPKAIELEAKLLGQ